MNSHEIEHLDPGKTQAMTSTQEERRIQRVTKRRNELIDAAIRVVRREGPMVSMDKMAAEAGITKPILYRHFGDRAGLCAAIGERVVREIQRELEAAFNSGMAARELVKATIDAFLGFIERDTDLYRFLTQVAPMAYPMARKPLNDFERQTARRVATLLHQGLEASGQDTRGADVWAHALVGSAHAIGNWWVDDQKVSREEIVEELTELVWNGLARAGRKSS